MAAPFLRFAAPERERVRAVLVGLDLLPAAAREPATG